MFNIEGFNVLPFNSIEGGEEYSAAVVQNNLTLMFDTEVVPITYIGEQYSYANSPWMPHSGFYPNQWLNSRDLNLYFAGNDGYVYRYGSGATDNGAKIDAHYTVPAINLKSPDLRKRLRWIDIDAERNSGSFMRVWYRTDAEEEWQLLCEIEQGNITYPFVEFPKPLFRKISFKFENAYTGCEFTLNGFSLDMVIHGQQREMI
jgi:hypothetical protein